MDIPKVSIIVPVYNVEKYIHHCIDSILSQTFSDFECILVDDCSPDTCPSICDDYAARDARVKVIHKPLNENASLARKTGFEISDGLYILFVDSDDFIESDMLEKMYSKALIENNDMVYCDYFYHDKNKNVIYTKVPEFSNNFTANVKCGILDFKPGGVIWNKLVKRDIIEKITFPIYQNAEDKYICTQVLYFSANIGYIDSALYHYLYHHNSLVNNSNNKINKYKGIYNNFNEIIYFLLRNYGEDLSIFEPELKNRINWLKENNPLTLKNKFKNILRVIFPSKSFKIIINNFINNKYFSFLTRLFLFYIYNTIRWKINFLKSRDNLALLIEFYYHHGETLPGFAKYLLDLNYNVDIVIRKPNVKKGRNDLSLFSCFMNNEKVRIKLLSDYDMNYLLRSSIVSKYNHIIINTFDDMKKINPLSFVNLFKLQPVCVAHNPNIKNKYFQTNKIISLVKIESTNRKPTVTVNPHYFCKINKKNKSEKTVFVTLNSENIYRRNLNLLFEACDRLYQKGISNFTVKVIGRGSVIPERYRKNIHDYGFLDFKHMFKEISNSDILLALIDHENIQYTKKASGSYQISYGFLKPIVLQNIFSDLASFSTENSILYNDNNLDKAMEKCINMSNDDYQSLVSALEISKKNMYNLSLNNLKKVLETPINNEVYTNEHS